MKSRGFTLIELMIVLTVIGLGLTLAAPRLSAFLARPEDREIRNLENFILQSSRTALRRSNLPAYRAEAKPLRIKTVPKKFLKLLIADTELAQFEFKAFRIEEVEEEGRPVPLETEFPFNSMGMPPPFSMKLASEKTAGQFWWRLTRIGDMRLEPVR